MKNRILSTLVLSSLVLSSCSIFDFFKSKVKPNVSVEVISPNYEKESQIFNGGLVDGDKYKGYEFYINKDLVKPTSGIGEVDIYAFNDFHGAVLENDYEIGLKKLGSFFKEHTKKENTLVFDQGDTWQGSFESNYHHGAIVQDVFNYSGVSLRTVGNHDFDWGVENLLSTSARKINEREMPCLASNVYNWSNGEIGKEQQEQIGKEYATFYLNNGLKIGVIGVIGEDQITSICSPYVKSIGFSNHIEKIKEISDFLRTDKNCDIIVASSHEYAYENMLNCGITNLSEISGKRYVDLILNGHAHSEQKYTENHVNFVQWSANGESFGKITLKYNFATKKVVDDDTEITSFYSSDLMSQKIDSEIEKMVDDYLVSTNQIGDEILSDKFDGFFDTDALANLMSEAIYKKVISCGEEIDFAVCNYARQSFYGNNFTFRDLYRSFPFDNQIVLMDVSGYKDLNSISHNYTFREDTNISLDYSKTYRIAIIDYLGLHQNKEKEFDYFPNANNKEVLLHKESGVPFVYRDILEDYLKSNPQMEFNASNYSTLNEHFRTD